MRSRFVFLLLVGTAVISLGSTNNEHGWKVGQEYAYHVRSHTLTGLEMLTDKHNGIVMKAILKIQCNSPDILRAKLIKPQYAQVNVHKYLWDGLESDIPDMEEWEFKELPISTEPFMVKMKHGVVRDLIVGKDVQTWEVNIIKSIISQFQVDTYGENAKKSKHTQIPTDDSPYATYRVMEDSVGGKCEVLYDITPLTDYVLQNKPELVPRPELRTNGENIHILKTKNYNKCEQRVDYHFGIGENANWESNRKSNENIMRKSSISRIVISGNLKDFILQSAVTTNQMIVKPKLMEQEGSVISQMNVTLISIEQVTNQMETPMNPESTGNLVYTYNNPLSETEHKRSRKPSLSTSSMSMELDSGSTWTSSDELHLMNENKRNNVKNNIFGDKDSDFWQPTPKLHEVSGNGLIPLFMKNSNINPIKKAETLVHEITEELEDPNMMPEKETLEKFTILCRVIRSMNLADINKLEENLHSIWNKDSSEEKKQVRKENARAVLRDAVADAGTGPALLVIKKWIEEKKIEGFEAATVVSRIPKTARLPTAEYVDAFFLLASNSKVREQMFLNSSAILSFAELVRLAQVSDSSIHNNYPVHVFGHFSNKQNDAVLRKYIPFFAEQLRRAIKDGDSPRIQVYILALGLTGHPKMLNVFEPYLEGKERVSTFQRLVMVISMAKLVETNPSLARSVLYKLYLNTLDAHQIRCAAVYLLMETNPPLDMLMRMARFTNYDYSIHVNAAVRSAIESAAELTSPEWQELAKNAYKAKDLLNTSNYGFYHSQSSVTDAELNNKDLAYRMIHSYIGSDDSIIPSAWYIALQTSYNGFVTPTEELGIMVSSVKSMLEMYWHKNSEEEGTKESLTEKVARMLKIESDALEQVEGNFFVNSKYHNQFYSFDNHTIERLSRTLMDHLKPQQNGGRINLNKLMSYDIIYSCPTETGLPFVYSLKVPTLLKVGATTKVNIKPEFHVNINADVRLVMAAKVQGTVGFVTPFDRQRYNSGLDIKIQGFLPGKVDLDLNPAKYRMDLVLRPLKEDSKIRIVHYSVVPYTSQHDFLSLRPLQLERNTHRIQMSEPTHIKFPEDPNSLCTVEVEGENLVENFQKWATNGEKWHELIFPLSMSPGTYEQYNVYVNPNSQQNEAITFSVVFDNTEIRSNNADDFNKDSWKSSNEAPITMHNTPDSSARRKYFLQEVVKSMNSAKAFVMDAALEISGTLKSRHIFTLSAASSNVEQKFRSLLYLHTAIPDSDITYELCANGQMRFSATPPFDYEKVLKSNPLVEFGLNIRHGEQCSEGKPIDIKGMMKQSEDYKKYVLKSSMAKKCKQRMDNGFEAVKACRKATNMAAMVNNIDMTIDVGSDATNAIDTVNKAFSYAKKHSTTFNEQISKVNNFELQDATEYNNNDIRIKMQILPDTKTLEGTLSTPEKTITFSDIDLSDILDDDNDDDDDDEMNQYEDIDILGTTATCILGQGEARTFDGKTYPVQLGKCEHVLMTTFPQNNPNEPTQLWRIPANMKLSVTAQEMEDNKKEVKLALGNDQVVFKPSDMKLQVLVNGQKVKCSQKQSYQHIKDDKTLFEIFELPGPAMRLMSDEYDIDAVYDGKHIRLTVDSQYQKSVRGLCGDFDNQPENDFVTPKNCLLKKPELFAATYALKDQCKGVALKNAREAEKSMCARKLERFSDVISDEEAGRSHTNWKQWGYHNKESSGKLCYTHRTIIVPKEDEVCFTTWPAPVCSKRCVPVETKQKKYKVHCMPKNERSLEMKRRIEEGAIPDHNQYPPTGIQMISVPLECAAA